MDSPVDLACDCYVCEFPVIFAKRSAEDVAPVELFDFGGVIEKTAVVLIEGDQELIGIEDQARLLAKPTRLVGHRT
jgi:hypothetical protein